MKNFRPCDRSYIQCGNGIRKNDHTNPSVLTSTGWTKEGETEQCRHLTDKLMESNGSRKWQIPVDIVIQIIPQPPCWYVCITTSLPRRNFGHRMSSNVILSTIHIDAIHKRILPSHSISWWYCNLPLILCPRSLSVIHGNWGITVVCVLRIWLVLVIINTYILIDRSAI